MPETQNKPSYVRDILFTLLGTILAAGLGYFSGHDLKRLELLRGTQRDAYIDLLRAQVNQDLRINREEYTSKTTDARKRIAVYGSKDVVEALAKYWRTHFDPPMCVGPKENDDVTVYMSMRQDLVPFWQQVSEADMMMLMFLCRFSRV